MAGTNFSDNAIARGGTINTFFGEDSGFVTYARCTVANIPSAQAGYAVGCLIAATDTGGIYTNTGTAA